MENQSEQQPQNPPTPPAPTPPAPTPQNQQQRPPVVVQQNSGLQEAVANLQALPEQLVNAMREAFPPAAPPKPTAEPPKPPDAVPPVSQVPPAPSAGTPPRELSLRERGQRWFFGNGGRK